MIKLFGKVSTRYLGSRYIWIISLLFGVTILFYMTQITMMTSSKLSLKGSKHKNLTSFSNPNSNFLSRDISNLKNDEKEMIKELVIVPCHAVLSLSHIFDKNEEFDDDDEMKMLGDGRWSLLNYQKDQSLPSLLINHLFQALKYTNNNNQNNNIMKYGDDKLLVLSGGRTRRDAGNFKK